MLGTVAKAGKVLDLFTGAIPEWGVREVAEELGVSKSSAHELLSSLTEIGLTRRTGDGRYRLGWRIFELNQALTEALTTATATLNSARPVLGRLAAQLNTSAQLAALRNHSVAVLDVTGDCHANIADLLGVQSLAPHNSALGRVLLAQLNSAELEEYWSNRLPGCHPGDMRPAQLASALTRIRVQGYASDINDSDAGVCWIAAPISGTERICATAISLQVRLVDFRRNPQVLVRAVQRAAEHIARGSSVQAV